jgi:tetratricopeptide (TPR) repeat protein
MARDTAYALIQSGDEAAYAKSLSRLAHIQLERRQLPEAAQAFHGLLARSKGRDDYASRAVSADALAGLGQIAQAEGDFPRARQWLEQALEQWKQINPTGFSRRNIAAIQRRLSAVLLAMEQFAEARPLLEESRAIFRSIEGEDSLNAAWSVTGLAKVAARTGRDADAHAMFEEAIARQSAAAVEVDLLEALEGHAEFALRRADSVGLAVRQIRRAARIVRAEASAAQAIEAADQLRRRRHVFEVQVEALWQYAQ